MTGQLNPKTCQQIAESAAKLLIENYAFPDIAEKMAVHIRKKLKDGCYDECRKPSELGEKLTEDMRKIARDLHLTVYYSPEEAAELLQKEQQTSSDEEYSTHWWTQVHSDNYGIPKVEYLIGNIGYIDLRYFAPVSLGGKTAVAAMNFLSQCDALIFDLRQCGGGDPFMVQLFESYLFSENKKPKLLLNMYSHSNDELKQIWTLPHIPGKRLPDVPVYVLTSHRTFSGGEDMAYTLKHHGRACIVGETTGGGANSVVELALGGEFVIVLPNEYPAHPITGGNWEGTGVQPDIEAPFEKALPIAHTRALESLSEKSKDRHRTRALKWYLQRVKAIYQPSKVDVSLLRQYAGEYRGYEVKIKDKALVLSRKGRQDDWPMIPITSTIFTADEDYNARFEIGEDGRAVALIWLGRDDETEIRYARTAE